MDRVGKPDGNRTNGQSGSSPLRGESCHRNNCPYTGTSNRIPVETMKGVAYRNA